MIFLWYFVATLLITIYILCNYFGVLKYFEQLNFLQIFYKVKIFFAFY